ADFRITTPGYFQALHIPLVKGRDFTDYDNLKSTEVVIINEAFADKYFPNQDPIGKHVKPSISLTDETPSREIVGVVVNLKITKLSDESAVELYTPYGQIPFGGLAIVVRTVGDPQSLVPAFRGTLKTIDKDLPFYDVKALDEYFASSIAQSRFNSFLLGIFATVALVLS